jgi:SAM-dependent methyltransferase
VYRDLLKQYLPTYLARLLKQAEFFLNKLIYKGKAFYCPYCDYSYRTFFTGGITNELIVRMDVIGAGVRHNVVCPGCGSTDRDRLLYAFFESAFAAKNPKNLLHIAPEPCIKNYLRKKVEQKYTYGAKFHEGLYYSRNMKLLDLENLPFQDNSFDWIVCNHVLEHVTDETQSLSEILRVLTPGGKAVLQVPWTPRLDQTYENENVISEEDRLKHFGQADHLRLYGKDYPKRLELAGFRVSIYWPKDLLLIYEAKRNLSFNPREVIFVGEKQA